jgi:hypothetical protein
MIPTDFTAAVKDIKLAILEARARAARVSNVEALKLYFYVGGYISKKTRNAKWGSGAINALSERLQVELPGLRGFSAANIKYMRLFYDAWMSWFEIRHLPSNESTLMPICHSASDELTDERMHAFLSIQGYSQPIGIATYQALKNIPQPYKVLAPIIDGVRRVMTEYKREQSADVSAKHEKKRKKMRNEE